jgi:glycosyltransferase involved in cell wall biosynthesis
MNMAKVSVIVPTFRCAGYFGGTFPALGRALMDLAQAHEVRLAVVLNGSGADDERAVRAALRASPVPYDLQVLNAPGKNNAINHGVAHARAKGSEIVQIVDDDQDYAPGTLRINADTLLALRERLGVEGLVGSRHIAVPTGWNGLTDWVARLAFAPGEEAPRFCIGGSMCAFAATFPALPADATGIADDAYVCNVYYLRHRDLYRQSGFLPIVFPQGSMISFRTACRRAEYFRQQVRIRYGVLAAYAAFPEHADELRRHFNWRFHCDNRFASKPRLLASLRELVRWHAFNRMRHRANLAAEAKLASGVIGVDWSPAETTKPGQPGARAISATEVMQ